MAPTAIVFSSISGSTSSGPIVWRSGVSGITRCSTSKYLVNFSQQVWTSAPKITFGFAVSSPRRSRQLCLCASSPSMIASEEPIVAVPAAAPPSGALKRPPIMLTTRWWITSVCGYSSWSTKLRLSVSVASCWASGSIQVVTKEARLSVGLPSRLSSSWISW